MVKLARSAETSKIAKKTWRTTGLIAITIATAGFDRFDFLQGAGSFAITPFYLLAPLATWSILARRTTICSPVANSRGPAVLLSLLTAFVVTGSIAGLLNGVGATSLRRLALLVYLTSVTWGLLVALRRNPDTRSALQLGAWSGLILSAAMSFLQYSTWITYGPGVPAVFGPLNATSPTLGNVAPRVAGLSVDPNRGALFVCLCVYILAFMVGTRERSSSKSRTLGIILGGLLILASFSRTGIALYLILTVWTIASRRSGTRRRASKLILPGALFGALTYWLGAQFSAAADLDELLSERVSAGADASGGLHVGLLEYGIDVAMASPLNLLMGIGFGESPTVLQGLYPGNEYANFHSGYIGTLVEGGVFSLFLMLALLLGPWARRHQPITALLVFFSVFYQATLDPTFWILLGIGWCLDPAAREGTRRQNELFYSKSPPFARIADQVHLGVAESDNAAAARRELRGRNPASGPSRVEPEQ